MLSEPSDDDPTTARPFANFDPRLVFDLGMYRGEDTAFYLSRGFRVIGVEANPRLIPSLTERFGDAMKGGRVVIVPCAVGARIGAVELAVPSDAVNMTMSTVDAGSREVASRRGIAFETVEVEMTTVASLFQTYGVPYYLKSDVEGMDRAVIESLAGQPDLPPRVSIESATAGADASLSAVMGEVALLRDLGYRQFKLVGQRDVSRLDGTELASEGSAIRYRYEEAASGPFGDEAPGNWCSAAAVVPRMAVRLARHHLVSPRGRLGQTRAGDAVHRTLRSPARMRQAVRWVAPGMHPHRWYDLHARP